MHQTSEQCYQSGIIIAVRVVVGEESQVHSTNICILHDAYRIIHLSSMEFGFLSSIELYPEIMD